MMLQEKRIFCTIKEPDKNHLWLRPKLDKDGFDLLYYGVNGWTPLINCGCNNPPEFKKDNSLCDCED